MRRLMIIGCVSVCVAVTAAHAQAQVGSAAISFADGRADLWPRGHVGMELGIHTQEDFTAESFLVGGWYRVAPAFALELALGFFNASSRASSEGTPANPFLGAYYVSAHGRTMVRVGAGIAIGVANEDSPLLLHWLMRGLRDLWMLLPHSFNLVPRFRLDTIVSRGVTLGIDADLGFHDPTEGGDWEITGQTGFDVTGRIGSSFELGLRLQLGMWLTGEGDDVVQTSAVPFVRALFGPGYAELRLLMNLDEPAGFAFDRGKFWMLTLGGGARF